MSDENETGGGNPSLDGWFYQCDVSVLAALDLLVVDRVAKVIQLEPANQEDIEAELDVPRVKASVVVRGQRLIVQAKLRRSGQWTPSSMRKLVEHGTKRPTALKLLEDENVKYVLVTSADVSGSLSSLQVNGFSEPTSDDPLPSNVFPASHANAAAGRFAVLAQFSPERLVERINALLLSPLCVPASKLGACREELRKIAMTGMRKGLAWQRGDVEAVIKSHGGSIPSERDSQFVKPTNWDAVVAHMNTHNAIVITGPSGTGKTTLAKALYQHYKGIVPGLDYVEPTAPGELWSRPGAPPTLFYVEDPWGKYEIRSGAASWTAELQARLLKASAQQRIVVTTRTDILAATIGTEADHLRRWEVHLDASKYGERELGRMFETRVRQLSSAAISLAAVRAKDRVLKALQTPFEIDRFVTLLQGGVKPSDENESEFVARVLNETHTNAIENEVQRIVLSRGLLKAGAVLWGLMAARGGLARQDVPMIRRAINRLDPAFQGSLDSLVNALIAGGNLRQPSSDVTYTHPRVELGLMSAMRSDLALTEVALDQLTSALINLGGGHRRQGVETAARLISAVKNGKDDLFEVSYEVQAAVDGWLEEELTQDRDDYLGLLRLAAVVGSSECVPAEIARWFKPVPTGGHYFIKRWKQSARDDAWFARMKAHPATKAVCDRFIRLALTEDTRDHPHRMANVIDQIATGLDPSWLAAAKEIVHHGEDPNAITVAFGAMRARENREPLLQLALAELRRERPTGEVDGDHWAYEDGHFNADWQPYEDYSDDDFAARELVSAYAEATRDDLGWQALMAHPDARDLKNQWFDAMKDAPPGTVGDDEIAALLNLARDGYVERRLWRLLMESWRPSFAEQLRERLILGSEDPDIRVAAAGCALAHAPEVLGEAAQQLAASGKQVRLLELARDAKEHTKRFDTADGHDLAVARFEQRLPEAFGELAAALVPLDKLDKVKLSDLALDTLVPLLGAYRGDLRVSLLWLAAANERADEESLRAALSESTQPEEAEAVVRAAATADCLNVVRLALKHPRAKARLFALKVLAPADEQDLPDELLALATDPSALVRRAVLDLMAARPERYVAELVALCEDTWCSDSAPKGEFQNHPIARAAAKALSMLAAVPADYNDGIVEAALETDDLEVTELLFTLLTERGDEGAVESVLNQVFTNKPNWSSVVAAEALAKTRRRLPDGALARADVKWLKRSHQYLVAAAAEAVGNGAPAVQVLTTASGVAALEDRRVLLISIAMGAERQSSALARQVLEMLPPGHPGQNILAAGKKPLPYGALDNLGDIRTVTAVAEFAGPRIAARPSLLERSAVER